MRLQSNEKIFRLRCYLAIALFFRRDHSFSLFVVGSASKSCGIGLSLSP
ncbi:hypothetical protein M2480_000213 [Parabacteroides sp. PFB2-12]|nr:hypothetical protein [Parabacteroides sp. PM6-13]MDH6389255.1 hypothetical protein [Parabacteroides sp. PFB2-12]